MSKTAELLCQLTTGMTVKDQWRTSDRTDTVVAMVGEPGAKMRERAELLAGTSGRSLDGEVIFCINGLEVAVSDSRFGNSFVAVSPL